MDLVEWCTRVGLRTPGFSIDYGSRLLLLGSCFTENVGRKFAFYRFDAEVNPTGIVYNPLAVANALELLVEGRRLEATDLTRANGKWVSFFHHGSFSRVDREACLEGINSRLEAGTKALREANVLLLTWGTAWVYKHVERGMVAANCHKIPEGEFSRYRAGVEEIVARYAEIIPAAREVNPGLRVVFTVSPIRHWRDGAHGNQLSKATLLLAVERLQERFDGVFYFPAYEVVLDELRDYRFYASDMLHLSGVAEDYVWEVFKGAYVSPSVFPLMRRIEGIRKRLVHRPLSPGEDDEEARRALEAELDDLVREYRRD